MEEKDKSLYSSFFLSSNVSYILYPLKHFTIANIGLSHFHTLKTFSKGNKMTTIFEDSQFTEMLLTLELGTRYLSQCVLLKHYCALDSMCFTHHPL